MGPVLGRCSIGVLSEKSVLSEPKFPPLSWAQAPFRCAWAVLSPAVVRDNAHWSHAFPLLSLTQKESPVLLCHPRLRYEGDFKEEQYVCVTGRRDLKLGTQEDPMLVHPEL